MSPSTQFYDLELYELDSTKSSLVQQANSAGTPTDALPVAQKLGEKAGFDLYSDITGPGTFSNVAVAALSGKGRTPSYTVN